MKALIVDDEKHVRDGLNLLADWKGNGIEEVLEAENGEEAIELIATHRPAIVFSDMRMPKMNGIELLEWISNSKYRCKTIVVSGYDDFEYMRNAIYYNSFDYILKPIDPEILNETLARAIGKWKEEFGGSVELEDREEDDTSMKAIKDYIFENYQSDVTLQDIAEKFYLSREHISRKFKQEYNETITDYLMKIRIEKAKELLTKPQLKVYEIAYKVGYQNEKYFSKVFKKYTGLTPNEFRKG
ncbi:MULTISPECIES: response regulator transcription factor [Sutcliffiella]|uniref:response regulator transcription factor n=1 Tax=Sutcliffiella TaxID=2837511 RepID=UPI0022DDCB17|nr:MULTISPECIES: response regulator [Sutcliffiella]MED4014516.1 response regulator [Sutcliffiella cohnii]WBL14576.1 response regulator [Sutcliffiella sp. NC1]